jgi:trimethylamine:corrinoid methyltransferase-like protein
MLAACEEPPINPAVKQALADHVARRIRKIGDAEI